VRKHSFIVAAALAAAGALVSQSAYAVQPFTLVKDAYPEPVGQWELELSQDAFWHPKEDHDAREFGTEFELERGINDKLALSVFAEVSYQDNADKEGLAFEQGGIGGQYIFASPATESLGVGLIGEIGFGERGDLSGELFLALQKDTDKWIFAYNLGFETSIERAYGSGDRETGGTLINAAGAEYALTPHFYVGLETAVEMGYSEWRTYEDTVWYAGPVIYWTPSDNFYLSVGVDYQLTDVDEEAQYRAACVAGYYF
jgi:hypothetical protein